MTYPNTFRIVSCHSLLAIVNISKEYNLEIATKKTKVFVSLERIT